MSYFDVCARGDMKRMYKHLRSRRFGPEKRKHQVDERDPWTTYTALMFACANGKFEAVKALLEFGADPSLCEFKGGLTSLHFACLNRRKSVVRLLLDVMDDPEIWLETHSGKTAFELGCIGGSSQIVDLFLERFGNDIVTRLGNGAPETWNYEKHIEKKLLIHLKAHQDEMFVIQAMAWKQSSLEESKE